MLHICASFTESVYIFNFCCTHNVTSQMNQFLVFLAKKTIRSRCDLTTQLTCPWPKRPWVSMRVTTLSVPRSICRYSMLSLDTCSAGHQAPPFVSLRILHVKTIIKDKYKTRSSAVTKRPHWGTRILLLLLLFIVIICGNLSSDLWIDCGGQPPYQSWSD